MGEREVSYTQKNLALRFLEGQVFLGPQEDIGYAKFVRIGKLFIVSPNWKGVNHYSLVTEPSLGAGDRPKFLLVARRLAELGSAQIDAGEIQVSLEEQTITLSEQSYGLHHKLIVPVNLVAREISRQIMEILSPGFTVTADTPPSFKRKF